jgi:formylglycine-generating enzyme required for sulfatase activity
MTATIWHDRLGAAYVRAPAAPACAPRAALLIMRTPVTNALWRQAVAAGACDRPRSTTAYDDAAQAQHPVGFVGRAQAHVYAAWIGGRLPRDSEWTWAAQGDDGRTDP